MTARRRMWWHRGVAAAGSVAALVALALPSAQAGGATPTAPAEPTMGTLLSGTVSRLAGTHVWTDYAYDDRGSTAETAGSYPAQAGSNAADLIQLQLHPGTDAVRVRAVLETLTDAAVPSLGVGIDTDADPNTGSPGVPGGGWKVSGRLGLERFVIVEASGYRVLTWNGRSWIAAGTGHATVDTRANTMTATVPIRALGAVGPTWRVVGLTGLAVSGHSWATGDGPIYDLAYVREPSTAEGTFQSSTQAAVLSGTSPSSTAVATMDVAALRRGVVALPHPVAGFRNTFLYRSHLDLGEGIAPGLTGGDLGVITGVSTAKYAGPYQPYVMWFPAGWSQARLHAHQPLLVYLHGAGGTHLGGQYGTDGALVSSDPTIGTGVLSPDAVIVTPLGRGEGAPDLQLYDGPAEQDVLDVVADVTTRFTIDQDRVVLSGYSLGGVGTFRLAQLYPDRWAGAVEIVGAPDLGPITAEEEALGHQRLPNQLENLRNLPFRMAHSRLDELEALIGDQPDQAALALKHLGYDFRYWQFARRDHLTFPLPMVQCEIDLALARGRVRDPARVVYSQEPAIQTTDAGTGMRLHHDSAYWMSGMVVRGGPFAPGDKGTVDVTNLARADRQPATADVLGVGQNITAGRDVCGANPALRTNDTWTTVGTALSPGLPQPKSNAIRADLTRVSSVTLHLGAMSGLDLHKPLQLQVTSDGPATIHLLRPSGTVTVHVGAGTTTTRV